jgi:hypothetical protein
MIKFTGRTFDTLGDYFMRMRHNGTTGFIFPAE